MIIRNYLEPEGRREPAHGGAGEVSNVVVFGKQDFDTPLNFIIYTEIEPGSSIGYHRHGENEEVYVILEGSGQMVVNGEARRVKAGDVILNKPGWSHSLENSSGEVLKILVFEVEKGE